jgi:hypothetical protein
MSSWLKKPELLIDVLAKRFPKPKVPVTLLQSSAALSYVGREVAFSHHGLTFIAVQSTGKGAVFTLVLAYHPDDAASAAFTPRGASHEGARAFPWPPALTLTRENVGNRLGKFLRLNRELQTGDEAFDQRAYVSATEDTPHVAELLASPKLRADLLTLLEWFPRVTLAAREGAIVLTLPGLVGLDFLDSGRLNRVLDQLVKAAEHLPAFQVGRAQRPPMERSLKIVLAGLGAFVVGFVCFAVSMDLWHVFDEQHPLGPSGQGAIGGLAAFALAFAPLVALIRGTPSSFSRLLVASLVWSCALASLGATLLHGGNALLASQPPQRVPAQVLSTDVLRGKSTSYLVTLDPQGDIPPGRFSVSQQEYQRLLTRSTVEVSVRPGALGWFIFDELHL